MGWILGFGISGVYLFGVMVSFRILHIRRMTEYLRWKNEKPNKVEKGYGDYPGDRMSDERQRYSFYQYMHYKNLNWTRGMSLFWPLLGPYVAIERFCTPEVKIPDQAKIKELEKL